MIEIVHTSEMPTQIREFDLEAAHTIVEEHERGEGLGWKSRLLQTVFPTESAHHIVAADDLHILPASLYRTDRELVHAVHIDPTGSTLLGYNRLPTRLLVGSIAIKPEDLKQYHKRKIMTTNRGVDYFDSAVGRSAIDVALVRGDLHEEYVAPGNLFVIPGNTLHNISKDPNGTDSRLLIRRFKFKS